MHNEGFKHIERQKCMKNNIVLKKAIVFFLAVIFIFSFSGCGSNKAKIAKVDALLQKGTWVCIVDYSNGGTWVGYGFKDGEAAVNRGVMGLDLGTTSGTYIIKSDKIIISLFDDSGFELTYSYNGSTLEIWNGELKVENYQ